MITKIKPNYCVKNSGSFSFFPQCRAGWTAFFFDNGDWLTNKSYHHSRTQFGVYLSLLCFLIKWILWYVKQKNLISCLVIFSNETVQLFLVRLWMITATCCPILKWSVLTLTTCHTSCQWFHMILFSVSQFRRIYFSCTSGKESIEIFWKRGGLQGWLENPVT